MPEQHDVPEWEWQTVQPDDIASNYELARKYAGRPGNDRALTYAVLAVVDELTRAGLAWTVVRAHRH